MRLAIASVLMLLPLTVLGVQPATAPSGMILIPAGAFNMGTSDGFPYEGPIHAVTIHSFYMDKTPVTVAEFKKFIDATHYKTDAEKFGWSGVFSPSAQSWTKGDGATWQHPDGPNSTANDNEPVTQVSFADAEAYAKWAGKRLPTEAEFEYAARGGLKDKKFAWGDDFTPNNKHMPNTWQGHFPEKDTAEDGFASRSPVASFPPNGYGLYDMTGNVWHWCSDFFDDHYYDHSPKENPTGPTTGSEHVLRGGSWLCSANYCQGYRVAARNHTAPDSGLNNLGFRCAKDAR